jgi:NuA3 HAT complex component NTO1
MGACIQCGNKACYQAFHVTCARRARLFLRMKSTHAGSIDASVLKAFCDRHVPPDWRREHDVDSAITEAKRYYRHTMRHRRWADSQTAALALVAAQPEKLPDMPDELALVDDAGAAAANKRKKAQPQKTG